MRMTDGDRQRAEDIVQETLLRAWLHPEAIAERPARPWLFAVARNLYASYCRSRVRENGWTADLVLLWPGDLPSPFETAALNEFERRLEAAVASLPLKYREALLLVAVEQLRPAEAARCSPAGAASAS